MQSVLILTEATGSYDDTELISILLCSRSMVDRLIFLLKNSRKSRQWKDQGVFFSCFSSFGSTCVDLTKWITIILHPFLFTYFFSPVFFFFVFFLILFLLSLFSYLISSLFSLLAYKLLSSILPPQSLNPIYNPRDYTQLRKLHAFSPLTISLSFSLRCSMSSIQCP